MMLMPSTSGVFLMATVTVFLFTVVITFLPSSNCVASVLSLPPLILTVVFKFAL